MQQDMMGGNHALQDYMLQINLLNERNMADYNNGLDFAPFNGMSSSFDSGLGSQLTCDTFQANQSMSFEPPDLTLDLYSPDSIMDASPVSEDFVIPSQTTFMNTYDLQSPMVTAKSLHFEMSYESPQSEFDPNFAIDEVLDTSNMGYYDMPPQQESMSSSPAPTPTRASIRPSVYRPPPSVAALQRIQGDDAEEQRRIRYRLIKDDAVYRNTRHNDPGNGPAAKFKRIKRQAKDLMLEGHPGIRMVRGPRKECTYEGCTGKFQRQEHLKRHEKTHQRNADIFPCLFCPKTFGRSDNLKSHVKLHTYPPDSQKKSRRTAYKEGALEEWQRMDRKRSKTSVAHEHDNLAIRSRGIKDETRTARARL